MNKKHTDSQANKQNDLPQNKIPAAEINLTVRDDSQILSPYSEPGKPVISGELADYLENVASGYLPAQPLSINFYSDCIDDGEKPVYDKGLRNYFSFKAAETRRDMMQKTFMALIFTLIGVIGLTVMFVLSAHGLGEVLTECLDIFAWVFLWEAVDQFFIERKGVARKCRRFENFVNANISFHRLNAAANTTNN